MKFLTLTLILGLAAPGLVADPTMHEKITEVLAHSDQMTKPPPTAREMSKTAAKPGAPAPATEATVQLPDYEVVAPRTVIPNKSKIELDLAKNAIAVRQEEAQLKSTVTDKVLNNDAYSYQLGPATFEFGSATASNRAAMARYRLSVLDVEQTIALTSLSGSKNDQKQLLKLLGDATKPTPY